MRCTADAGYVWQERPFLYPLTLTPALRYLPWPHPAGCAVQLTPEYVWQEADFIHDVNVRNNHVESGSPVSAEERN